MVDSHANIISRNCVKCDRAACRFVFNIPCSIWTAVIRCELLIPKPPQFQRRRRQTSKSWIDVRTLWFIVRFHPPNAPRLQRQNSPRPVSLTRPLIHIIIIGVSHKFPPVWPSSPHLRKSTIRKYSLIVKLQYHWTSPKLRSAIIVGNYSLWPKSWPFSPSAQLPPQSL